MSWISFVSSSEYQPTDHNETIPAIHFLHLLVKRIIFLTSGAVGCWSSFARKGLHSSALKSSSRSLFQLQFRRFRRLGTPNHKANSSCSHRLTVSYLYQSLIVILTYQHPSGFLWTPFNTRKYRLSFTSQRFRHLRCEAGHYRCKAYGTAQRPADAIVIGGGLAGMSASMALLDRGGSVVMVEKHHSGTVGKVGAEKYQGWWCMICVRIWYCSTIAVALKRLRCWFWIFRYYLPNLRPPVLPRPFVCDDDVWWSSSS